MVSSRGQLALYRSLVEAVGKLAGNVAELVVELYTAESSTKYHELVQGIADIALTIVEAVPPPDQCPDDLRIITELLRAVCRRLRTSAISSIKEVQKIIKNDCNIVALSNGARSLCEISRHAQGLVAIISAGPIPPLLQDFLEVMESIQNMVDEAIASHGKHAEKFQKRICTLQELLVSTYEALPPHHLTEEPLPLSNEAFALKQNEIQQYIALLLRQMSGKKSSAFVSEMTKNTKEIFHSECLDCCLYATRKFAGYSLAVVEEEAPAPQPTRPKRPERPPRRKRLKSQDQASKEPLRRERSPSLTSIGISPSSDNVRADFEAIREKKRNLHRLSGSGNEDADESPRSGSYTGPGSHTGSPVKWSPLKGEKRSRLPVDKKPRERSPRRARGSKIERAVPPPESMEEEEPEARSVVRKTTSERLGQKSLNAEELEDLTKSLAAIAPKKKKKKTRKDKDKDKRTPVGPTFSLPRRESSVSVPDANMTSVEDLIDDVLRTAESDGESASKDTSLADGLKRRLTQSMRMSKVGIAQGPAKKIRDFGSRISSPAQSPMHSPMHSPRHSPRQSANLLARTGLGAAELGPERFSGSANASDTSALVDVVLEVFKKELPWFAERWVEDDDELAGGGASSKDDTAKPASTDGGADGGLSTESIASPDLSMASPDVSNVSPECSTMDASAGSNEPSLEDPHHEETQDSDQADSPIEISVDAPSCELRTPTSELSAVQPRASSLPFVDAKTLLETVGRAKSAPHHSVAAASAADARELQVVAVTKLKMRLSQEIAQRFLCVAPPLSSPTSHPPIDDGAAAAGKQLKALANAVHLSGGWLKNSRSTSNILGPLEVPRLRQVAQPLATAADKLVADVFKLVEEGLDETALEESCATFYEQLSRIAHLCAEGPGKQEAMSFLDGPSLRERITSAAVSGVVDEELRALACTTNKPRLLQGQLRAALHRKVSNFRALVVQCCSTIDSIAPDAAELSNSIIMQIVTQVINFLDAINDLFNLAVGTCFLQGVDFVQDSSPSFTPRDEAESMKTSNVWMERAMPAALKAKYSDIEMGTINSLVNELTSFTRLDEQFKLTFVATYPSFMSNNALFEKLMERYNVPSAFSDSKLPIQLRVCVVIKSWMSEQFFTFEERLILKLREFIHVTLVQDNLEQMSTMLSATLAAKLKEREELHACTTAKALPAFTNVELFNVEGKTPAALLLEADPKKLALHLCYHDFAIFKNIQTEELLNQAWNKKFRAPNVCALIDRCNHVSYWVASVLLWHKGVSGRVKALERLIDLLECVVELNNYTAFMAIYGGMNMASCSRLKLTYAGLHEKQQAKLDRLQEIADPIKSFSNYRKKLRTAEVPCIPYLGTHLMDLTFVDEGNENMVEGYINFGKYRMTYQVIQVISMYQQQGYSGEPEEPLNTFTRDLPRLDEESLWNLSTLHEPRKPAAS